MRVTAVPQSGSGLCPKPKVRASGLHFGKRMIKCQVQTRVKESSADAAADVMDFMELPRKAGMPLLGMFGYVWSKSLDVSDLHKELGPMFALNMGLPMGGWNLAVADGEAAREILKSSDKRFVMAWPDTVLKLIGPRGRLFTDAEALPWRRTFSNILSPEAVMSLQVPVMAEDFPRQLREAVSSGEPVPWIAKSRRLAFGVATRATMGTLVSDDELDDLCALYDNIGVTSALDFGFKDGIPGTEFYNSVQARRKIEAVLYSKIKAAIDNPESLDGERSVVLRLYNNLLEELKASGETKTNEEIAKQLSQDAYFMMFAGTDTTSTSMVRCALVLDQHPEWFARLKEEQDALRAECGDTLDRKVLSRSSVASAIALEIMRVTPAVPAVFRKAVHDTVVQGIAVPKGTRIMINMGVPSRATGSSGSAFDPGQWLKDDGTAAKTNDSPGYLTFGAGPRRCLGQNLAMVEVIMVLALMGREVDSMAINPKDHDLLGAATVKHPTGIPITFTPRARSA
eukprot:jgi/Ulvmu1/10136/UM006_0090.1